MTQPTPKRLAELQHHYPNALKRKSTPDWATFKQLLPPEMLKEKRFVRYFLNAKPEGGTAKIPLGNHSDPDTWSTFDGCVVGLEPGKEQGVGYNFLHGEIHGLDIDHCRNPETGKICPEAMVLLSRLKSWAEYSVSGQGIHVFFKGNVRGKELREQCLQYWNPKSSPRFFALTCDMVGDAFKTLKDVGDEFNYIFATARHISAKIREELKEVDYEQWAALPVEKEQPEQEQREKSKQKSRKLHKDFDIEDFLTFYGLEVDNVANNSVGKCYRLTSCPIKGEKHVGQNSTTTNFILSNDGGLGFHCQSTGCVEWSVAEVIKKLAEDKEPYPGKVYVEEKKQPEIGLIYEFQTLADVEEECLIPLWPGCLFFKQLIHSMGASSEGKSPTWHDVIARITTGAKWPDGTENTFGPRSVILMAAEDNLGGVVRPRIRVGGGDVAKVKLFTVLKRKDDLQTPISVALDRDMDGLRKLARTLDDLALIVIDPITNYLGDQGMNNEEAIRTHILMPLVGLARECNCCIVTVGHLNKREISSVLQKGMGATAFTGVPRKVFLFGPDPKDEDKYTHVMKELRDKEVTLKYKTVKVEDSKQTGGVIQIEWLGSVDRDADEIAYAPKQREKTANKEVQMFLKTFLREGAKPTRVIEPALKEAGIDCANWQRAAKGVAKSRKIKNGAGAYEWVLLEPEQATFGSSFDTNQTTELGAPIQ